MKQLATFGLLSTTFASQVVLSSSHDDGQLTAVPSSCWAGPEGKVMPCSVWPSLLVPMPSTRAYGSRGMTTGVSKTSERRRMMEATPSARAYPLPLASKDLHAPSGESILQRTPLMSYPSRISHGSHGSASRKPFGECTLDQDFMHAYRAPLLFQHTNLLLCKCSVQRNGELDSSAEACLCIPSRPKEHNKIDDYNRATCFSSLKHWS